MLSLLVALAAAPIDLDLKIGEPTPTGVQVWVRPYEVTDTPAADGRVPGVAAEVTATIERDGETLAESAATVDGSTDFAATLVLDGLPQPTGETAATYQLTVTAQTPDETATRTLDLTLPPGPTADADALLVAINCIEYDDRDAGADGFRVFETMRQLDGHRPDACIFTGDTVYYDRDSLWTDSLAIARLHWQRQFGTTHLREFMREVPCLFQFDDHDVYVDDCWPGRYTKKTGDWRFEDGVRTVFEQLPLVPSQPTFRASRWGRHLELWLLEGRLHRSPNTMPDGPGKTILGPQQMAWLRQSLAASEATFKLVVSPTPIVGPDRESKNDNYANDGFTHEGDIVRQMLADAGAVVLCGDRHWQYRSIDPATGLEELSIGPATDEHAGGKPKRTPDWQPWVRVAGGFVSIAVASGEQPTLAIRHHDVAGDVVHERTWP